MKRPFDTTEEADRIQFAIWRKMTVDEKLRRILHSSELVRTTFEAHIRSRHPDYSDWEARLARIRFELGDTLFREVYREEPLLEP
ncbi:hypothetical protein HQ576_00345 [bacterium]|nr:hypothetical protein [bacterium]